MEAQKSISKNFTYSVLLKIFNIIFPLATFPYVARVLTADGIGRVDFSLSIIQYFILISQLGIPTYAIRECAKCRDDRDKLAKTVQEILLINFITTAIAYLLLIVMLFSLDKIYEYKNLILLLSINIIMSNLGVEWFYHAIEDYKFITVRSVIVKFLSLILVFLAIHNQEDFYLYAAINVFSVSAASLTNFARLRKHIPLFKKYSKYNIIQPFKSIIVFFGASVAISIYTNLNITMLGYISSDRSVGLYTAADKMVRLVLPFVTTLSVILIPRMSYYINRGNLEEANRLISKSLDFIFLISMPAIVGIFSLAEPIILLFAGDNYIESAIVLRILCPILLVIAMSNLIGIQILVPNGKERIVLLSTFVGALINFTLNMIMIPVMFQNGAAIATLIAESSVTFIQLLFANMYIKGNINYKNLKNYLVGSILILLICKTIDYFNLSGILQIMISITMSLIIYLGYLLVVKDHLAVEAIKKLMLKI